MSRDFHPTGIHNLTPFLILQYIRQYESIQNWFKIGPDIPTVHEV